MPDSGDKNTKQLILSLIAYGLKMPYPYPLPVRPRTVHLRHSDTYDECPIRVVSGRLVAAYIINDLTTGMGCGTDIQKSEATQPEPGDSAHL